MTFRTTPRRCLLVLHDAGGTVPPMMAVAEALVALGHDVTVLGQPSIRERAVAAGCTFVAFAAVPDYARRRPLEEQLDVVAAAMTGRAPGDDVHAVVEDRGIDVAVVDCNLAGAAAAVEALGLPSAILLHSLYRTYVDTWFGELWPFLAPSINETRAGFGLGPCDSWTDLFCRHDRLYAAVPRVFDAPTTTVPVSMRHVGFLVPGGPSPSSMPRRDRPTVLVTLGTTAQGQGHLWQTVLDAFDGLAVDAVATTAGQVDPSALRIPRNVAVREFVPHRDVLPRVDAVVAHAGLGTVAAALTHGLPLVCVPIARDQLLNAARVEELGAGARIDLDAATPDAVRAAIVDVLDDPGYRTAAGRLAAASAGAGGATAVAADLEQLSR